MKAKHIAMASSAVILGAGALLAWKYRPAPERPKQDKTRIACVGDSITFGHGVIDTRKRDAWAYVLGRKLGDAYQVINYGFSGTTLQREGDLPYRRVGFLKKLKKAEPSVILFMLGTNDSKPYNWSEPRYRAQYEETISELPAGAWPHKLALMAPPKAFPEDKTGRVAFDIDDAVIRDVVRPTVFPWARSTACR